MVKADTKNSREGTTEVMLWEVPVYDYIKDTNVYLTTAM